MYSDSDFILSNYNSIETTSFSWSAPSNIALVKYWGKKENGDQIPANPSISFTLKNCKTMESFCRGLCYVQKPNSDLLTKKLNENSFGTIKTDQHQNCKKMHK